MTEPGKELVPDHSRKYANEALRGEAMAQAWELRRRGMSLRAVAKECGLSIPGTKRLLDDYLHRIVDREAVETYRELELARLDHLQEAAETLVDSADPEVRNKGINTSLRISESRRNMLGLDAAKKAEMTLTVQTDQEKAFADKFKELDERNRTIQAKLNDEGVYDATSEQAEPA